MEDYQVWIWYHCHFNFASLIPITVLFDRFKEVNSKIYIIYIFQLISYEVILNLL